MCVFNCQEEEQQEAVDETTVKLQLQLQQYETHVFFLSFLSDTPESIILHDCKHTAEWA